MSEQPTISLSSFCVANALWYFKQGKYGRHVFMNNEYISQSRNVDDNRI